MGSSQNSPEKSVKCFEKPKTKHYNMIDIGKSAATKTYPRKKKITKPLNLADFTIPGYRRKKKKTKKARRRRIYKIPLTLPPRKPHKKTLSVEPTFAGDPVDDIVPLRKSKTRAARKYASTNPENW